MSGNESRMMHMMSKWSESTIKDVTARNPVVSRSIVSASKLIFYALKIASAWTARTSKEVKKEDLSFMEIITPWLTCNRLQMQPLVVPLGHLATGLLWHPRREKVKNSYLIW